MASSADPFRLAEDELPSAAVARVPAEVVRTGALDPGLPRYAFRRFTQAVRSVPSRGSREAHAAGDELRRNLAPVLFDPHLPPWASASAAAERVGGEGDRNTISPFGPDDAQAS